MNDFYLWYSRIFSFAEIDCSKERMEQLYDPDQIDNLHAFVAECEKIPMTILCVAQNWLTHGTWRKITDDEKNVSNWRKHLGLDTEEENDG